MQLEKLKVKKDGYAAGLKDGKGTLGYDARMKVSTAGKYYMRVGTWYQNARVE